MHHAAKLIADLARRDTVDPDLAAAVLELDIIAIEQVTAYRREYQLGSNELFVDATAIVGGHDSTWSVIDLVPRDLAIDALCLPPHQQRSVLKYTTDGPMLVAIEHHLMVRAGELVVLTAGDSPRVERITLMAR